MSISWDWEPNQTTFPKLATDWYILRSEYAISAHVPHLGSQQTKYTNVYRSNEFDYDIRSLCGGHKHMKMFSNPTFRGGRDECRYSECSRAKHNEFSVNLHHTNIASSACIAITFFFPDRVCLCREQRLKLEAIATGLLQIGRQLPQSGFDSTWSRFWLTIFECDYPNRFSGLTYPYFSLCACSIYEYSVSRIEAKSINLINVVQKCSCFSASTYTI